MFTVKKLYYYGHPNKRINKYQHDERFLAEISKVKGIKGQLYSFDTHYLALNTDLNIIAPTKWVFQHFNEKERKTIVNEVIEDIDRSACTYIIAPTDFTYSTIKKEELIPYLNEKYSKLIDTRDKKFSLYRRK
jgi:hypothetical protein